MTVPFDFHAATALFAPLNADGSFTPEIASYLGGLGRARPSVLLAFAPKTAGTFLRTAAITATGGQLVRTVHAQAGRDASFYLPTLLLYYAGGVPDVPLVTHVHMQALPGNRHIIEALDMRPVIMVRPLADMLVSYLEMMDKAPLDPEHWLNIAVPAGYPGWSDTAKSDFIIDMMAPWFVSYFATWLDYAARDSRVMVLDYDEFREEPVETLERILAHSRLPRSHEVCAAAWNAVWRQREEFRFRQGISGRGRTRFSPDQIGRLARLVDFYAELAPWKDRLIPPP